MLAREAEYVVFDVETTGLSAINGDRIVEIGAVRVKNGQIVDEFESFVNPQRDIPEEAQQIHHISSEMVEKAPTSEEVLPSMIDFISGACLVGHNIKFDLDFLCYELALAGRKVSAATPALDTLKMAKVFLPLLSNYRLSSVAHALGITIEETHRALSDVKLTASILLKMIDMASDQKIDHIHQFLSDFGVVKPSFPIVQTNQSFLF